MVFINEEGKFNDNSYLIEGYIFQLPKQLGIYVIENNGVRMMMDTGVPLASRKVMKKLKELGLFPIQKLLLTHSHWDHVQAYSKMKRLNGEEFELLASEKAIENIRNPEEHNKVYGFKVEPIMDDVTSLKDGDVIDLNGLELEVINLFGHTMDSIGIIDRKNKNIFTGDAIFSRSDENTMQPINMPPFFNESELLKTYEKLRGMKGDLNSISLNHFGVWTNEHFDKIINEMEVLYFDMKDAVIKWHGENNSIKYIAEKFHEKFIPNSTVHTKENIVGFEMVLGWAIDGLKIAGIIK
jgi:glyoxylase-like metal-dependent hydrolase (beta-lactamase superfamily II)